MSVFAVGSVLNPTIGCFNSMVTRVTTYTGANCADYSYTFSGYPAVIPNCPSCKSGSSLQGEEFQGMSVHPNPANGDRVMIEVPEVGGMLTVRDVKGRLIHQIQMGSLSSNLDLSGMDAGLYFLSYRVGESAPISSKLVISPVR